MPSKRPPKTFAVLPAMMLSIRYLLRSIFPGWRAFFFTRLALRLPENARRKHTYLVAGSGSGKSELLKVLMLSYIRQRKRTGTVILMDPHGDIAAQTARFKEHKTGNTLILMDPSLKAGFTPCINPLDIGKHPSPQSINYMAECLTEVFKDIVGAESTLTTNMETLLKAVLTVLLIREGSTLKDLQTFLRDDENAELVQFAMEHSPIGQRHFFQGAFYDRSFSPTKAALYTKLQSLLNSEVFYNLTIGQSTLDLREAMNSRKTIVFNLSKGVIGQHTSAAFGRLVVGMIQGFSFERQSIPESQRVPVHLFIDECHNFISPSIKTVLAESRKYALFLTLAQQFYAQDTSPTLRAAILNNTAVKIAGTGEGASLDAVAKFMTGVEKSELQNCETGKFFLKVKASRSFLAQLFIDEYARPFRVTTAFLGFRHAMHPKQWRAVKQAQIQHFYRPLLTSELPTVVSGHSDPEEYPQVNLISSTCDPPMPVYPLNESTRAVRPALPL